MAQESRHRLAGSSAQCLTRLKSKLSYNCDSKPSASLTACWQKSLPRGYGAEVGFPPSWWPTNHSQLTKATYNSWPAAPPLTTLCLFIEENRSMFLTPVSDLKPF